MNKKINDFIFFHGVSFIELVILVYLISDYYISRKPDLIDSQGNAKWDQNYKHYTRIGRLLHDYKYCGKVDNTAQLANIIVEYIKNYMERTSSKFDYIVPIPSTDSEKVNSFEKIVRRIAEELHVEYIEILYKVKDVKIKEFEISERKQLIDLFKCETKLPNGSRILLLDDFFETGKTLCEGVKSISKLNPTCDITTFAVIRDSENRI